jgi:hypothetical protein
VPYREERELVIRLHLSAEFGEDYEGDDDGYEWYRAFDARERPAIVNALLRALTASGDYRITPINRGLDAHEELELSVERITE